MNENVKYLRVACDGSALNNPNGPAGWAWYISEDMWEAGGEDKASNNRMELMAVYMFLKSFRELKLPKNIIPIIILDSQYVHDSVTMWSKSWIKNGWKLKDGSDVKNAELMKKIVEQVTLAKNVQFELVKGHSGHPLNEGADTKACDASFSVSRALPVNAGPGLSLLQNKMKEKKLSKSVLQWPRMVHHDSVAMVTNISELCIIKIVGEGSNIKISESLGQIKQQGQRQGWWFWETNINGKTNKDAGYGKFSTSNSAIMFSLLNFLRNSQSTLENIKVLIIEVDEEMSKIFTPLYKPSNETELYLAKELIIELKAWTGKWGLSTSQNIVSFAEIKSTLGTL